MVTGSMSVTHIDSSLYDILEPFDLKRIYESVYTNKDKMLGSKWMFNMETCIEDLGEEIVLQMEDMHLETFAEKKGETGTVYENKKPGNINYLLKKTEEGYEVKDTKQRRLYCYNRQGKLTERRDRFGNQVILTYQGENLEQISLSSGQYLKFGYENIHPVEQYLPMRGCKYSSDDLSQRRFAAAVRTGHSHKPVIDR